MKKSTLNLIIENLKDYLKEENLFLCESYKSSYKIIKQEELENRHEFSYTNPQAAQETNPNNLERITIEEEAFFNFLEQKKIDKLLSKEELLNFIHEKRTKDDSWGFKKTGLSNYQNIALDYLASISEDYVFDYVNRPLFITSNIDSFDFILEDILQSPQLRDEICSKIMSQHKLKFADYQTKAFGIIQKYATNPRQYDEKFTFIKPQAEIETDLFNSNTKSVLEVILNHDTLNAYNTSKQYSYKELIKGVEHACFALNDYLDLLKVDSINIIPSKESTKVLFCTQEIKKELIENMLSAHLRAFLKENNYYDGVKALNLDKSVVEKIIFEENVLKTSDGIKSKKQKI